jgi:hypothetical protein
MRSVDSFRSRPWRPWRGQREAHGIGAVFVDQVQRVEHVAERLGHLLALLVAHERVDIDGVERPSPTTAYCIIIIRATQKKMMSKPVISVWSGNSGAAPAVSSGQPSVPMGQRPEENQVSSTSGSRQTG